MGTPANDVVLLHGLGRSKASMLPLSLRLGRAGFIARRVGYPSTRLGVGAATAFVREMLNARFANAAIDLVGHSLGGLIAATLLRDPGGLTIGRVVQLGAPNLGSPLAARLGHTWPLRRMCGPALRELGPHDLSAAPLSQIGAIAGTAGLPGVGLSGPNDGAVTLQSACSGAGHHATVRVVHTWLPASAKVAALVAAFLRDGRFSPEVA